MEVPEIKISVALVTRNRPESLERTLKSLHAMTVQPWEVVISDDSGPEHAPATQALAAQYGCRYITGPQRGLYANRNHVAPACRGTHIRTMDDDHEFPPDHEEKCRAAVASDPQAVWIIGEFYPGSVPSAPPPRPGQLHPRGFSVDSLDDEHVWAISDGASIYPRALFDRGLRFADDFKFGASYLEWGSRLFWLGVCIRHLETTWILHHYDPKARSFMNQEITLSATLFAILCHSFLYQPTVKNKTLTLLEIAKQLALHRRLAWDALANGRRAFARQQGVSAQSLRDLKGGWENDKSVTTKFLKEENEVLAHHDH